MRNTILAGLALATLAAAPLAASERPATALVLEDLAAHAAVAAGQYDGVQVWLDGRRDLLQPHDRVRVRVRADRSAYLAVFHIDTNGDLDVLFPRSPSDDGWVEGGRTLALGTRGEWEYLRFRGGPGMGYVFAVALDEPLELWRLRDLYRPRQASWDGRRTIWGDPFYAMDEIVRAIVPDWAAGYESVDHYTYHVGRRYTHPRYACYDGYGDWYHARVSYWPSCDRVRIILVQRPYYYDTYRWRGSRRGYYGRYYTPTVRTVAARPLHGYKESTQAYAPPQRASERRPQPASGAGVRAGTTGRDARPGAQPAVRPEGRQGSVRPAVDAARGGASDGARARPATADAPDRGSYERPEREQPRARPADEGARRPAAESAPEPRREREAAPAAEPRRESAPPSRPQRESAPASQPQRESAPASRPQRESRPSGGGETRSEPRARPSSGRPEALMMQMTRLQQDKPADPARDRPTFQRRGAQQQPRAAQPRRESPPPQREARPARDSGSSRSTPPSDSGSRPPEG